MAELGALLAIVRSAPALTVVEVVLLVLLPTLPSAVPVDATVALLESTVPLAVVAGTVTWIVKTVVPPGVTVTLREQVTTWPVAVQSVLVWNVVPLGRVSDTVIPPTCADGPLFVTVSV